MPDGLAARIKPPAGVELVPFREAAGLKQVSPEPGAVVADWRWGASLEALAEMDLDFVQTTTAGVDWIRSHVPPRIPLHRAAGVHDVPVAEWVVGAVLAGSRNLLAPGAQDEGGELHGETVTIVGLGSIGGAVARRLEALGANVVGVTRRGRKGTVARSRLLEAVRKTRAVVVLLPLEVDTRGMLGPRFFEALPDGALIVSPARFEVFDAAALSSAVLGGRVRAVLDCDRDSVDPALLSSPRCVVTPHVAGRSPRTSERLVRFLEGQLDLYARGEPLAHRVSTRG